MATLQSDLSLTYVNARSLSLATLLAIFLQIVTAGPAFPDGGHGGAPIAGPADRARLPNCGPREKALEVLERHGEKQVGHGVGSGGGLVELYANPETGSWSLLISPNPRISCMPTHGHGWRRVAPGQPS